MGIRMVTGLKLQVSFAEYRLFYRALSQKRPVIFRSLLLEANPYFTNSKYYESILDRSECYTWMSYISWGTKIRRKWQWKILQQALQSLLHSRWVCVSLSVWVSVYVCRCICVSVYLCIYICVNMYIYSYVYIYIYI